MTPLILLIGPPTVGKSWTASYLTGQLPQVQSLSIDQARTTAPREEEAWQIVRGFLTKDKANPKLFESSGLSHQLWELLLELEPQPPSLLICLTHDPLVLHERIEGRRKEGASTQRVEDEHAFVDHFTPLYESVPSCDLNLHTGYDDTEELVLERVMGFLWEEREEGKSNSKFREILGSLEGSSAY